MGATEVIKFHKVVAFHVRFAVDVSLPPTGDIQQYSLETAGSVRRHGKAYGPLGVPLASATYDQAATASPATTTSTALGVPLASATYDQATTASPATTTSTALGVPLASATYDQADRTLTLTPTAPAPVRRYRLVKQGSFELSDPPGRQVNWHVLVGPHNPHPSHGSSDWYDYLDPLTWPMMVMCSHGC